MPRGLYSKYFMTHLSEVEEYAVDCILGHTFLFLNTCFSLRLDVCPQYVVILRIGWFRPFYSVEDAIRLWGHDVACIEIFSWVTF